MALATVTGTITDIAAAPLVDAQVRIVFDLPRPAFRPGPGNFAPGFATKKVVDNFASTGTFSIELESNVGTMPPTPYRVRLEWLEGPDALAGGGGYVGSDHLAWDLWVPEGGGNLANLLELPANPSLVWESPTEPLNPLPGYKWLNTTTGVLYEWS